jgi:hypothetical protein
MSANTHERDLPRLADLSKISRTEQCSVELSFCLPTSLAFAKRLTWEQTPWIPSNLHGESSNPISKTDADTISHYLGSHLGQRVKAEAIQNALLFGSTFPLGETFSNGRTIGEAYLETFPYLFVIFPHAPGPASHDPTFLKIWHDQIVKPAFDAAWKNSGLTRVYGADVSSQTRILPPPGTRTLCDALPASGFLERFRNSNPSAIRDYWPSWSDDWHVGGEGKHSGTRANIYHSAWEAMKGMLKDHPDLSSYQNPILIALCRSEIHVNPRMSTQDKCRTVAQEWDPLIDARFVKPGSFKIVFETVVGTHVPKVEPASIVFVGNAVGREFKRMADGQEVHDGNGDGDVDAHRSKRVKTED